MIWLSDPIVVHSAEHPAYQAIEVFSITHGGNPQRLQLPRLLLKIPARRLIRGLPLQNQPLRPPAPTTVRTPPPPPAAATATAPSPPIRPPPAPPSAQTPAANTAAPRTAPKTHTKPAPTAVNPASTAEDRITPPAASPPTPQPHATTANATHHGVSHGTAHPRTPAACNTTPVQRPQLRALAQNTTATASVLPRQ